MGRYAKVRRYTTEYLQHRIREFWARRNHPNAVLRERNRTALRFNLEELRRRKVSSAKLSRVGF